MDNKIYEVFKCLEKEYKENYEHQCNEDFTFAFAIIFL